MRPHQCTFVPDSVGQFTSDHGWSLPARRERLRAADRRSAARSACASACSWIRCPRRWPRARDVGADRVELYTESYARAHGTPQQAEVLAGFAPRREAALREGLGVNAGHDLNRDNLTDFLRAVPGVQEVSIGHALIADALELGYAETVRDYLRCIQRARVAARRRVIYGIGTDVCDIRRIAATLERRGERFAEKVLGPHEIEVFRARRAQGRGARRPLPRHALLGQGGVLEGDRPRHAHADDLARLRDRQRAAAASREIRLHGELAAWFDARRPAARTSASPTKPTTRRPSSSSKPRTP